MSIGGGGVIIIDMEEPPKQFELFKWPPAISPDELMEELNDKFRRAGNYGRRKGEDLASKEETTKIFERKNAKPIKISWKKNLEEVRKIIRKLEEPELKNKKNKKQ